MDTKISTGVSGKNDPVEAQLAQGTEAGALEDSKQCDSKRLFEINTLVVRGLAHEPLYLDPRCVAGRKCEAQAIRQLRISLTLALSNLWRPQCLG